MIIVQTVALKYKPSHIFNQSQLPQLPKNNGVNDYVDNDGLLHLKITRDVRVPSDCHPEVVSRGRYLTLAGVHKLYKWGLDVNDIIQRRITSLEFYDINIFVTVDGTTYKYVTNTLFEPYEGEIAW